MAQWVIFPARPNAVLMVIPDPHFPLNYRCCLHHHHAFTRTSTAASLALALCALGCTFFHRQLFSCAWKSITKDISQLRNWPSILFVVQYLALVLQRDARGVGPGWHWQPLQSYLQLGLVLYKCRRVVIEYLRGASGVTALRQMT